MKLKIKGSVVTSTEKKIDFETIIGDKIFSGYVVILHDIEYDSYEGTDFVWNVLPEVSSDNLLQQLEELITDKIVEELLVTDDD